MSINANARAVFDWMIENDLLPREGVFDVTDHLVSIAVAAYPNVVKATKANWVPSPSDLRYYKKLTGINLMKLNVERLASESPETVESKKKAHVVMKCGIVYLVQNPAFPGFTKIGMTQNLEKRLAQYQTCDPHRSYKVVDYAFVIDRRAVESSFLSEFSVDLKSGEWVNDDKILSAFKRLKV